MARAQPCPRPARPPAMKTMDPAEDLCSQRNAETTAANLAAVWSYARGLASAVKCYEVQTKEGS